jgi:uncharacterized protein (DUF4415 family)
MKSATTKIKDGYENAPATIDRAVDYAVKHGNFVTLDEVLARSKKERITLHIDVDVLQAFKQYARKHDAKYQTLMNEALRGSIDKQFLAK